MTEIDERAQAGASQEGLAAIERLSALVAGDDQQRYLLVYQALANQVDVLAGGSAEEGIHRARKVLGQVGAPYRRTGTGRSAPSAAAEPVLEGLYADPVYLANSMKLFRDTDHPGIVGGTPTTDFPDCVAVGSANGWCCTGTLVAPNVVVTAGHCVDGGCSHRIFTGIDVSFPDDGRTVTVRTAVSHPDYDPPDPNQDIAVLVLDEEVDIRPRAMATADMLQVASFVRLAGYGNTDVHGTVGYGRRRMVDVPMAGQEPQYGAALDSEFVAGKPFLDRDSCNGDSGGPAYVQVGDEWFLAGATSRATASSVRPCGDGGIYTRVDAYAEWIRSFR